jgi:predicted ABC-class ATPase
MIGREVGLRSGMKTELAPINGVLQLGRKALEDPSSIIDFLSITKYSPVGKGFYGFVSSEELSEGRFLQAVKDRELVVKTIAFFNDSIVSVNNTKNQGNIEYNCFTFKG